jgi:hypothetical protein
MIFDQQKYRRADRQSEFHFILEGPATSLKYPNSLKNLNASNSTILNTVNATAKARRSYFAEVESQKRATYVLKKTV